MSRTEGDFSTVFRNRDSFRDFLGKGEESRPTPLFRGISAKVMNSLENLGDPSKLSGRRGSKKLNGVARSLERGWKGVDQVALEDEAEDDDRDDNDDEEEEGWVGGKKNGGGGGGESLRLLGGKVVGREEASKRGIQSSDRMIEGVFGEGRDPLPSIQTALELLPWIICKCIYFDFCSRILFAPLPVVFSYFLVNCPSLIKKTVRSE